VLAPDQEAAIAKAIEEFEITNPEQSYRRILVTDGVRRQRLELAV
jgi:hypothetical protein